MEIFKNYTGSAMLNNALMTIEALANLSHVSEITPACLLDLYTKQKLGKVNQRIKSYTMLFTKNGPLHNDKESGEKIYDNLMRSLFTNIETQGDKLCEISGLRYQTTFEEIFTTSLRRTSIAETKISGKDKTINRCWFPLIGGLGSDAQALPQAKFAISIHPICVAIMQFLPLSSLLYKGGILLVDSINFAFVRDFVADNVRIVRERIETTQSGEQIENIRDYSKGNYLLKAIQILKEKYDYDNYSDLNLWSFSNSGTGASCEIDHIPNGVIQKLLFIRNKPDCKQELDGFLQDNRISGAFLESLEGNRDFYFLYPAKNYVGVSIAFFERYQEAIENTQKLAFAKYTAGLVEKYKTKHFEKYLEKTDAYTNPDYRADFYTALLAATKNGEWSLAYHLQILDDPNIIPIKGATYQIYKLTHYFYQKKYFLTNEITAFYPECKAYAVCAWFIKLIEGDTRSKRIKADIVDPQRFSGINFQSLFVRSAELLDLSIVYQLLYSNNHLEKFGLLELLRIYYSQPLIDTLESSLPISYPIIQDFLRYETFAIDYLTYYLDKYQNPNTQRKPFMKFQEHVLASFPSGNQMFIQWIEEAIRNVNKYLEHDKWNDGLLYNEYGEKNVSFSRFAIELSLNQVYKQKLSKQLETINE